MDKLGLSTTQEYIIAAGLIGIAGVIVWYEYEKSQQPDQSKEGICQRIGANIPWWEEVGAVIATGGLALGAVGALEACKWYEAPPGIKALDGSVKIGVFQGTWQTRVKDDGTGWEFDCDKPVVLYGQYSYDQIGDLRKQYKGRENYLIYKPEDLEFWKSMCAKEGNALQYASGANQAILRKEANVNDALSKEYAAAFTANQPFPFTEAYIRSKCSGAGLVGSTADTIVSAWMGEQSMYDARMDAARHDKLLALFTNQCAQLAATATGPGVRWPPLDTMGSAQPMGQSAFYKLQSDETSYLAYAQSQLFNKFPPRADQDAWLNSLLTNWNATLQAAKVSHNWPSLPDYVDFLNQGCDDQHAKQGAELAKAAYDAARAGSK